MNSHNPIAGPLRSAVGSRAACYGCWTRHRPHGSGEIHGGRHADGCAASVIWIEAHYLQHWPVVRYARQPVAVRDQSESAVAAVWPASPPSI